MLDQPGAQGPAAVERPARHIIFSIGEQYAAARQCLVRRRRRQHGGGNASLQKCFQAHRRASDDLDLVFVVFNAVGAQNLFANEIEIGITGVAGQQFAAELVN